MPVDEPSVAQLSWSFVYGGDFLVILAATIVTLTAVVGLTVLFRALRAAQDAL